MCEHRARNSILSTLYEKKYGEIFYEATTITNSMKVESFKGTKFILAV